MADAQAALAAPDRLRELVERFAALEGFAEVVASLKSGHGATLDGVWGSSCALAAAALAHQADGPLVIVSPHPSDVDDLVDEFSLFSPTAAEPFPALDIDGDGEAASDLAFGQRLRLLKRLIAGDVPRAIVTSMQALLQGVPPRDDLARQTRRIAVGQELNVDELARWLVEHGFVHQSMVESPGEFSVRGGIVDVLAADWEYPVRIELFGDEVESLRTFEINSQRSLAPLDSLELTVVASTEGDRDHLTSYLTAKSWFLLIEPSELEEEGRRFRNRLDHPETCHTTADVLKAIYQFPSITAEAVAAGSFETTCQLRIESVERFSGQVARVREELPAAAGGQEVFIVCETEAETVRLGEIFGGTSLAASGRLRYVVGRLRSGFRLVTAQTLVLTTAELFRRSEPARIVQRRQTRAIDSFLELREGDLVVHVGHGVARYRGLKILDKAQQVEEHMELEFHGGTKLYVPVSKIGLVQKYVGGTRARPTLARLGGRTWTRQKQAVREAVTDLASDMLSLQAARATRPGISFPPDTEWQSEFDAAFPYAETPDQLAAIAAIKQDMQLPRPMDRLICGDVGYGKTEVAMRAAFKAIESGYQVAVLVPTTVLAEQHLRTFTSRMAEFPFEIAVLSRFLTRGQQNKVLQRLEEGAVDVVIGTHRLAQPDVRFQNLGLVMIDEEQRFGVEHKERLKALRHVVDVLTLTATPIPRTLHMSLLGLRDISNLETPPEDRLAVETKVTRFHPEMIRHAVLRELNREGQIFFVHNRVNDIEIVAERLRQIVPEASIGIAHGQMHEADLERVMLDFVAHRFDLLLATTIIESGLDIPNANTIFINEADRYGLADLHQLRGRVGRYKHRAYCYLLLDPNKALTPTAAKRMRAIEEFSQMGAGFAIAMRDLEIRGAGNILGTQQSGHIAAVGYELYCQLLEEAVRELKRLPPSRPPEVDIDLPCEAYIPRSYVPDLRAKIDLYRRLGRLAEEAEVEDYLGELSDRFGPPPAPVERLVKLARLRILAQPWKIRAVRVEEKYLALAYASTAAIEKLRASTGGRLRIVDQSSAYLPLPKAIGPSDGILDLAESLLRGE